MGPFFFTELAIIHQHHILTDQVRDFTAVFGGDTLRHNLIFLFNFPPSSQLIPPCHFRRSSETDLGSIIYSRVAVPPLLEETSEYHKEIILFVIDWVAAHHSTRYFKVCELRLGVCWLRLGGVRGLQRGIEALRGCRAARLANKSSNRSCDRS